jgi:hypothetical protein
VRRITCQVPCAEGSSVGWVRLAYTRYTCIPRNTCNKYGCNFPCSGFCLSASTPSALGKDEELRIRVYAIGVIRNLPLFVPSWVFHCTTPYALHTCTELTVVAYLHLASHAKDAFKRRVAISMVVSLVPGLRVPLVVLPPHNTVLCLRLLRRFAAIEHPSRVLLIALGPPHNTATTPIRHR